MKRNKKWLVFLVLEVFSSLSSLFLSAKSHSHFFLVVQSLRTGKTREKDDLSTNALFRFHRVFVTVNSRHNVIGLSESSAVLFG